jgi:hypothetical protein
VVPDIQQLERPASNREQKIRDIFAAAEESASILPHVNIILRTLGMEDDEFVASNHLAAAEFRKVRRQVFCQLIRRVKRHFRRIQEQRRDLMFHAGHVDMESLVADDMAFTRAVLTLRAALCLHYLRVSFAAQLARKACGEITVCVASQNSFLQQFSVASQT